MPIEVEAKFLATRGALSALGGATRLGRAALGPLSHVDEIDSYLDTADGRLAAARWACRLRHRSGGWRVSLKGPPETDGSAGDAWLHARPEIEGPADGGVDPRAWDPSAARERLLELAGGGALVERLRLVQRRGERAVSLDGDVVGTLSLDEVRVEDAERHAGDFRVVELELADGRPRTDLDELARSLGGVSGLTPDPRTKLERALALAT